MHLTIEIDFHQLFSDHDWDDSGASCHASPLRLSARRRATDTLPFVEACVAQILLPRFRNCALSLHVFFSCYVNPPYKHKTNQSKSV